jgi:tellurite resistance-related uncharacterized protein
MKSLLVGPVRIMVFLFVFIWISCGAGSEPAISQVTGLNPTKAHFQKFYDDLAAKIEKGDREGIKKLYKDSSKLNHRKTGKISHGPDAIADFWQQQVKQGLREPKWTINELIFFETDMQVKHTPKPHDYIQFCVLKGTFDYKILKDGNIELDPEDFEVLIGHWDDCQWFPESENYGR